MTLDEFLSDWRSPESQILVHTSGSTGAPKAMWVEKSRMRASARMTCDYLQLQPGNTALLCMPLDYIAGKMVVVRALEHQLRLISVEPSNHPLRTVEDHIDFVAMVPSQVYASLHDPIERERLAHVKVLLIGGGAISEELSHELRAMSDELRAKGKEVPRVYSSYGMTETLSHIALRALTGTAASPWYEPLPGVSVHADADQCLVIDAPAVHDGTLHTHDIVAFHPDGRRFRILGRTDNIICSGGLKYQVETLEERLRAHLTDTFCITSRPDAQYGEVMVLVVESQQPTANSQRLTAKILVHLHFLGEPFRHIKDIIFVPSIPLTPTGKINRPALRNLCSVKQLKTKT